MEQRTKWLPLNSISKSGLTRISRSFSCKHSSFRSSRRVIQQKHFGPHSIYSLQLKQYNNIIESTHTQSTKTTYFGDWLNSI